MLTLHSVVKTYPIEGGVLRRRIGIVPALTGVSLNLPAGGAVGLVGESGSGKTTLGKIIARHLDFDSGKVLWEGREAAEIPRRVWAGQVQMVFQDPAASLNPKLNVGLLLNEAVVSRSRLDGRVLTRSERGEAVRSLLKEVGLPDAPLEAHPHQFSGGERQRLAIARALAMRPRLLVADEPVSALDLSVQAQILNLLMELKQRRNLSLLVVSHDLAVVGRLVDRVVVMHRGAVVEEGETSGVFSAPKHPYTRLLLDAVPSFLK